MIPLRFILLALAAFLGTAHAETRVANVILVTFDGVRWQEFFHGYDPDLSGGLTGPLLPSFWATLAREGVTAGDVRAGQPMRISNPAGVSLPAYQALFAGHATRCSDNSCGRVREETFAERAVRELGLAASDVAVIASWDKIALAVEKRKGALFVNAGIAALADGAPDAELEELNRRQAADRPPWAAARYDRYTIAQAMRYLRVHRPRFLFISLNDTDEWGHKNDYSSYARALQGLDRWLVELDAALDGMAEYGRDTVLLVTTDHGRGKGSSWTGHGSRNPGSENIWLYGRTPRTVAGGVAPTPARAGLTHADIRPTIEAWLGLAPRSCDGCGRVIDELAP